MKLKTGDLLLDTTHGNTYAVIYVSKEFIVICQQTESKNKLLLFQQSVELINRYIKNNTLIIKESKPQVVDENQLSDSGLKSYKRNVEIITAIEKEYGPDYLKFAKKGHKPIIDELMKKYSLTRATLLRIINIYLQSGCQLSSLVEKRGKNKPEIQHNSKIRGRKPTDGTREAKLLDATDYNNMNESIELIRRTNNHTFTKKDAYIQMLDMHYTTTIVNDDGSISRQILPIGRYPSLSQYYSYLRKKMTQEEFDIIKTSAREHRNNKRALPGTERAELTYPGELCDIDATPVDIYLVSKSDPTKLVNRGHMYLIIDVLTGMILSGNVSFEDNSDAAVTYALINLKHEGRDRLLKETGVTLDSDGYWPTDIKPGTLRCDRGSEFVSKDFRRKCQELGIAIQLVPAATGSMKGSVEKEFNQFNIANSDFFEHKGLIRKSYDSDHKKTACMNIRDLRVIMVSYILYHNSRIIESRQRSPEMIDNDISPSPYELWKFYSKMNAPHFITMNINQYVWALMKPAQASKTRQGIKFKGLFYICKNDIELGQFMMAYGPAEKMEIRYDEASMGHIFYIHDGTLYAAELNGAYPEQMEYSNMSYKRFMEYRRLERAKKKTERQVNIQRRIEQNERLNAIVTGKNGSPRPEKTNQIKENTKIEKEVDNKEHRISSLTTAEINEPELDIPATIQTERINDDNSKDTVVEEDERGKAIREEDPEAFREAFLKKFGYKK